MPNVIEILEPLDPLPLECDGFTQCAHTLLSQHGIDHTVWAGRMRHVDGRVILPHFWIMLPDGRRIDYRVHMWLGNAPDMPHGVVDPAAWPNLVYEGRAVPMEVLTPQLLQILMTPWQPPAFVIDSSRTQ